MQLQTCRWIVTAIACGMVLQGTASAQGSGPACTVGIGNLMNYGVRGMSAFPYSASAKTTFEQRLSDGSAIRGYVWTRQARDAAGRTMGESVSSCQRDENGVAQPQLSVNVVDPTTNISMVWMAGIYADKQVHIFHQPEAPPMTQKQPTAQEASPNQQQPSRDVFKTEDLGMRTIAGVEAHGTRFTRTIPGGEEGNELPLVIVDETWQSTALGLIVSGFTDDPRRGRTTFEIEELSRGEPDPSVFAPPEGYKVVDVYPLFKNVTKP